MADLTNPPAGQSAGPVKPDDSARPKDLPAPKSAPTAGPASQNDQLAAVLNRFASQIPVMAAVLNRFASQIPVMAPVGPTPDIDKTVAGGKYIVGGRSVDAHGREVDDDGKLVHPEQQTVDAFGRLI